MNTGGSISQNSDFQFILSIGYEFEVPNLSKLTYIQQEGKELLVNTDINMGRIIDVDFFEEGESEEEALKKQLQLEIRDLELKDKRIIPTIINPLISDDLANESNLLLEISTDVEDISLMRNNICIMLRALCESIDEDEEEDGDIVLDVDEDEKGEREREEEEERKKKQEEEIKNNLYKFKIYDKETNAYTKTYDIQFYHSTQRACYMFTDIEWIATYYRPKQFDNIILETYTNAVKNIISHLDSLTIETGSFFVVPPELASEPGDNAIIVNDVTLAGHVTVGNLYAVPNSSVRYLDMYLAKTANTPVKTLNDINMIPQMTFSCEITHLFQICKQIMELGVRDIPLTAGNPKTITIMNNYQNK